MYTADAVLRSARDLGLMRSTLGFATKGLDGQQVTVQVIQVNDSNVDAEYIGQWSQTHVEGDNVSHVAKSMAAAAGVRAYCAFGLEASAQAEMQSAQWSDSSTFFTKTGGCVRHGRVQLNMRRIADEDIDAQFKEDARQWFHFDPHTSEGRILVEALISRYGHYFIKGVDIGGSVEENYSTTATKCYSGAKLLAAASAEVGCCLGKGKASSHFTTRNNSAIGAGTISCTAKGIGGDLQKLDFNLSPDQQTKWKATVASNPVRCGLTLCPIYELIYELARRETNEYKRFWLEHNAAQVEVFQCGQGGDGRGGGFCNEHYHRILDKMHAFEERLRNHSHGFYFPKW